MYTEFFPDGLDGLPFSADDMQSAFRWVQAHPGTRLRLTTAGITGVIEIYPSGALHPRWCLWRNHNDRLQLDDVVLNICALPYPTLDMALRFVALNLATDAC